jgi:NAD(P)-dependent dehydrogenase (short-subunit alcohol dehydrogenase family)
LRRPSGLNRKRKLSCANFLQPALRLVQPEEVAPAFVFFVSEADSSYITGEVLIWLGEETTAA